MELGPNKVSNEALGESTPFNVGRPKKGRPKKVQQQELQGTSDSARFVEPNKPLDNTNLISLLDTATLEEA